MFPCSALWFDSGCIFLLVYRGPGLRLQKTAVSPQLQFSSGHRHPVRAAEAAPHGPDFSADH